MALVPYLQSRHWYISVMEGADTIYLSGYDAKGEPVLTEERDDCLTYDDSDLKEAGDDYATLQALGFNASIEASAYVARFTGHNAESRLQHHFREAAE